MKRLEISAPTVEEAVQKAVAELGVSRDEVKITVLQEPESGEARVSVSLLETGEEAGPTPTTAEVADAAREVLENLLRELDLMAEVEAEEVEDGQILLSIEGEDLGILIGRRGQTLGALQYLLRTIISHRLKVKAPLTIDVEGYRRRHIESLQSMARHLADQVVSRREAYMMRPMTPYERRIIHVELADDPDVTTHSVGEGDGRRVVIEPNRPKPQNP